MPLQPKSLFRVVLSRAKTWTIKVVDVQCYVKVDHPFVGASDRHDSGKNAECEGEIIMSLCSVYKQGIIIAFFISYSPKTC